MAEKKPPGGRKRSGQGAAAGPGPGAGSPAIPACPISVCPVGMLLTFAGQTRPEVVEHLLRAGRELVLAATAVMNARAEATSESPRLQKIEID